MNDEKRGKPAQSQVHARYVRGTGQVLGRGLGGTSLVHGRCMRGTCEIKAQEAGGVSCIRMSVYHLLSFAVAVSGMLLKASGGLGHLQPFVVR